MKFITVIKAREGSKQIKNKNIYKINKKPLIDYTFDAAKKSVLKKIYVLTDSKKIKYLANKKNINTNYVRPKKLSGDKISLVQTLSHFCKWLKKKKIDFDYMVILQPTSPLRSHIDINNAIRKIKKNRFSSLFSISESIEHPYEALKIRRKKWNFILNNSENFYRRQDFDFKSFFMNGAIYIFHKKLIKKNKLFEKRNHGFITMPKVRSLEINDLDELKIIESIIKTS